MSTLSRYQKSGGFNQLLQLIETCGKAKQDNFLTMIEAEDSRWSQALKERLLTIDKIMSWDESVLAEIAARLQPLTLGTLLHGIKKEEGAKLLKTFTQAQKRIIDDVFSAKKPEASEINSAYLKVLQEVRYMITHNYIRLEKFAPEMMIPEDIEDKLGKSAGGYFSNAGQAATQSTHAATAAAPTRRAHVSPSEALANHTAPEELTNLRHLVNQLSQENETLKAELRMTREKLAQIKKIA